MLIIVVRPHPIVSISYLGIDTFQSDRQPMLHPVPCRFFSLGTNMLCVVAGCLNKCTYTTMLNEGSNVHKRGELFTRGLTSTRLSSS